MGDQRVKMIYFNRVNPIGFWSQETISGSLSSTHWPLVSNSGQCRAHLGCSLTTRSGRRTRSLFTDRAPITPSGTIRSSLMISNIPMGIQCDRILKSWSRSVAVIDTLCVSYANNCDITDHYYAPIEIMSSSIISLLKNHPVITCVRVLTCSIFNPRNLRTLSHALFTEHCYKATAT